LQDSNAWKGKRSTSGLKTIACTRVFDDEGRFNPEFDESDVTVIDGEMIVEAIGQVPDYAYLPDELKEKLEFREARVRQGKAYGKRKGPDFNSVAFCRR